MPIFAFKSQLTAWLKVIVCHLLAVSLVSLTPLPEMTAAPVLLLATGLLAAGAGRVLRLPVLFAPIQIVIPFAIAYADMVPAWTYLVAFAISVLVYWNTALEQVPFYLTNKTTFAAINQIARASKATSFVDLGCGTGGVVLHLAKQNPEMRCLGVETAPLIYVLAKLRSLLSRHPNCSIRYRSIWAEDLSGHDLAYCFLSPAPMARLHAKAKAEMRPGTRLVSNSFGVPGHPPQQVHDVGDGRRTRLHVWVM